ncbi:MAG: fused MFS/spermidine synthase [Streptosporangiales bacterium]|nr:fused MFS/spermidine synthase [Streptosporangiales bacterium]MBO0889509.1 fused MFS/spermidine synthase [Acidothermales bacterium]
MPRRRTDPPRPAPWRGEVDCGVAEIVPDPDRPYAAELFLNGSPQSHVDLAEPTYLAYEYVRHIADVLDVSFPDGAAIDVLHLGGGALTLPRYVAATRRGSRQRVVELDAALVALVREALPPDPALRLRVSTGDARAALDRSRQRSHDAVVVDVYAATRMPARIACRECLAAAREVVRPGGVVVMNLADGRPLAFARSMAATAADVFPHVGIAAEPGTWRGRRFGNLVLVGAHTAPPWDTLGRRLAGGPFPARLVTGDDLARFTAGAPVVREADAEPSPEPPRGAFDRR